MIYLLLIIACISGCSYKATFTETDQGFQVESRNKGNFEYEKGETKVKADFQGKPWLQLPPIKYEP